jgi:hypothetical protein
VPEPSSGRRAIQLIEVRRGQVDGCCSHVLPEDFVTPSHDGIIIVLRAGGNGNPSALVTLLVTLDPGGGRLWQAGEVMPVIRLPIE